MSDLINLVFEETIEMSFEEERQRIFNHVQHEFSDDRLKESINGIYQDYFQGWNPDKTLWYAFLTKWGGEMAQGCRYITNRMTREMSNDWWYSELIRYRIMKLFEEKMDVDTDIDEWAEHVFPPQYMGYEEEFEEEEDDPEPSDWNVSDRVLSYPRHNLQLRDFDCH